MFVLFFALLPDLPVSHAVSVCTAHFPPDPLAHCKLLVGLIFVGVKGGRGALRALAVDVHRLSHHHALQTCHIAFLGGNLKVSIDDPVGQLVSPYDFSFAWM